VLGGGRGAVRAVDSRSVGWHTNTLARRRPVTTVNAVDGELSGKWRFTTFGSIWTVDLKSRGDA
jgi:hypothetical protein